jgi:hypothetical protein
LRLRAWRALDGRVLLKQLNEFFSHDAAELFGVHDRDRPPIIAGDVMTDADGNKRPFRRRPD